MLRNVCGVFCLLLVALTLSAQTPTPQADRVLTAPALAASTRLRGHVPAWASAANDLGTVAPEAQLRVTFVLTRSPERQAAFAQLLADQQNPASPRYHHWLTPQQVGEQYGPTEHDLDALSDWLTAQGLSVAALAPSHVFLTASGSASVVGAALGTSFHIFNDNGALRRSAATEPVLPASLVALVSGISGIAETSLRPQHRMEIHPSVTATSGEHFVTPGDFATIFDLNPVYSSMGNGTGQRVAIIGRSRVSGSDITEYESATGLQQKQPVVIIPPDGTDPGISPTDDQAEAVLDVDRVLGTAPGVQADLVVSASGNNADGIEIAAQHEVQTLVDPVMTISFGTCESYAGASTVSYWDTLFAQAASEGISVFVSSGDSGAAGCDAASTAPPAYQVLSINALCSSSYVTCVGGTEFMDTANPAQYWSSANSASLVSVLGYIPEGAWNESKTGLEAMVEATGGGASAYVPKPFWQTGASVPADGARDVPDVSFPAAVHDGYFMCYAASGVDCSTGRFVAFGGTSAAAPSMAAVAALLDQRLGGPQGNLNPLFYQLAASNPSAFHDATPASSGNPSGCSTSIVSVCNNSTPSATFSQTVGLVGYSLATGYDQATGLGSLDIANFITAAAGAAPQQTATSIATTVSATSIARGGSVTLTATITSKTAGSPTGTVQFYADNAPVGSPVAVSSATVSTSVAFPNAGSFLITAVYSGDKSFAAASSPGVTLIVTGLTPSVTLTAPVGPTATGTAISLAITVGAVQNGATPTGIVRVLALTSPNEGSYVATVPLVNGSATTSDVILPAGSYTLTAYYLGDSVYSPVHSAPLPLTVVKESTTTSLSVSANDVGVNGSKQFSVSLAISAYGIPPAGTFQLYANGAPFGLPFGINAAIGPSFGEGGSFTLTLAHVQSFPAAGTYSISAAYSGDANYLGSTSAAQSVTVSSAAASYQITPSSTAISMQVGASNSNVDSLTILPIEGFASPVSFNCSVTFAGPGTSAALPRCTIPSAINLFPDRTSFPIPIGLETFLPASPALVADRYPSSSRWSTAFAGVSLSLFGMFLVPRRRLRWSVFCLVLFAGVGMTAFTGCGGGGSQTGSTGSTGTGGSTPGSSGTASGNYTITVTPTTTVPGVINPQPITITLTVHS
ncbi:MAG TPA: Ig-like domain repeat protein [Granulicella sp.]